MNGPTQVQLNLKQDFPKQQLEIWKTHNELPKQSQQKSQYYIKWEALSYGLLESAYFSAVTTMLEAAQGEL